MHLDKCKIESSWSVVGEKPIGPCSNLFAREIDYMAILQKAILVFFMLDDTRDFGFETRAFTF